MLLWKLLTCNNLYSQILMHLLCTYLDNCMPPNPRFPDGRPFSSQYFLRAPDKPGKKFVVLVLIKVCMATLYREQLYNLYYTEKVCPHTGVCSHHYYLLRPVPFSCKENRCVHIPGINKPSTLQGLCRLASSSCCTMLFRCQCHTVKFCR